MYHYIYCDYNNQQIVTKIEETFNRVLLFSLFFGHIVTALVLHSDQELMEEVQCGLDAPRTVPPNRLISSEVLLPLLPSNYGAHLDSLTTKRRELARLDLWQVVIRWRLFFPRGTSILATCVSPFAQKHTTWIERGLAWYYYYKDQIKNDFNLTCDTLCSNDYFGFRRGSSHLFWLDSNLPYLAGNN